jgi:hypothetical protein
MEQPMRLEMTGDEASLLSRAIDKCLKAMDEAFEHMDQTEAEISQLQSETRGLLDQLKTVFDAETNGLQRAQNDLKNVAELEGYEHELFWLQVENQLLKSGRQLPPTSDGDNEENER